MSLSDENKLILKHVGEALDRRFASLMAGRTLTPTVEVQVTIDTGPIAIAIAEGVARLREAIPSIVEQVVERLGEQAAPQVEVVVEPRLELPARAARTIRITHSDGSTSTVSEAG